MNQLCFVVIEQSARASFLRGLLKAVVQKLELVDRGQIHGLQVSTVAIQGTLHDELRIVLII